MTTIRYERNAAVEVRPDGDGAVALHVDTRQYFELNGSAWFIWRQLDAHPTAEALAARVTQDFEVPVDEARSLVEELLQTLVAEGLVRRQGGEPRLRDRVWRRLLGR